MSEPITARHCADACDRLSVRLDALLALLEAQGPPPDPAELDRMHAAAAEALASWGNPPGWDEWG
jgi:hypothetical protein